VKAHQQLQALANEIDLNAESIVYPAESPAQRSATMLLALRPTFAATY
jgi:hypothetical protein